MEAVASPKKTPAARRTPEERNAAARQRWKTPEGRASDRRAKKTWYDSGAGASFYAKRNANRRAVIASGDLIDLSLVWEIDEGICHICGGQVDVDRWDLDHIISLHMGGAHVYDNVAVSHPLCNSRKGAQSFSGSSAKWAAALAAYEETNQEPFELRLVNRED